MTTKAKTYDNCTRKKVGEIMQKNLTEYKMAQKHGKRTKRMSRMRKLNKIKQNTTATIPEPAIPD